MTNILKTINSYIKANINGLTIYNDLFPNDTTEGLISIHDPATRKVAEYIDGSTECQINVSYTARYANAATARSKLDAILNLLDRRKLTDTTDGLELKLNTVANVQFIGTDDKNNSIYTCSLNVEYKTKK